LVTSLLQKNRVIEPKHYILPAGKNLKLKTILLEEDIVKNFPPRISDLIFTNTKRKEISTRIEIVGSINFKRDWRQVLTAAGATIVQRLNTRHERSIEYILSAKKPSQELLQRSMDLHIPVCTTEWVIQCLVESHIIDPYISEKFCYLLEDIKSSIL